MEQIWDLLFSDVSYGNLLELDKEERRLEKEARDNEVIASGTGADLAGIWTSRYNWDNEGWQTSSSVCIAAHSNAVEGRWSSGTFIGTRSGSLLSYQFDSSDCSGSGEFQILSTGQMRGEYRCFPKSGIWELTRAGLDCDEISQAPGRPEARLMFVEILDADTLDQIDEIGVGASFKVRLTYSKAPDRAITQNVTIRTTSGLSKEVKVAVDRRVVLTPALQVVPIPRP